jgi:hypothetical protein
MTALETGASYYLTLEWDTTKGGRHALDYLTTWDRSFPTIRNETYPNPELDTSLFNILDPTPTPNDTFAIPVDPNAQNQISGQYFSLFGDVTITGYVLAGTDGDFGTGDDIILPG